MGRSAGVRPDCSLNNGRNRRGEQPDVQVKSLTQRLVSELWACQELGPRISEMDDGSI